MTSSPSGARLKRADIVISQVGFGCASLLRTPTRRGRQKLLDAAIDAGITHFDTARLYGLGLSERELGLTFRGRRDGLTIATKFGIEPAPRAAALARFQGPARALMNRAPALRGVVKRRDSAFKAPTRRYDAAIAARSLDVSLRELGTDCVDILFLHGPAPDDTILHDELVAFFEQAKLAGKIRAWGVSQDNHPDVDIIDQLGNSALLQVRSDVFDRSARDPDITFGVLGAALERITTTLADDPAMRERWSRTLGVEVAAPGILPRLLLADAIHGVGARSVLYSTTNPQRLASAAEALNSPPSDDVLAAFRACCSEMAS